MVKVLTRRRLLQKRLDMARQFQNMVRGSCPENETVAGILEPGLYVALLQPQEYGVDVQLLEFGGQEFLPLLRISCRTVCSIKRLDLSLERVFDISIRATQNTATTTHCRRPPSFANTLRAAVRNNTAKRPAHH